MGIKRVVIECTEIKDIFFMLQRITDPDTPISYPSAKLLHTEIELLFNSYLGLKDDYVDDDHIWFYEECCEFFNKIIESPQWTFKTEQVGSVRLLGFRGGLIIELK